MMNNLLGMDHFPKSNIPTLFVKHGYHGIHLRDTKKKNNSGHAYYEHYQIENEFVSICEDEELVKFPFKFVCNREEVVFSSSFII